MGISWLFSGWQSRLCKGTSARKAQTLILLLCASVISGFSAAQSKPPIMTDDGMYEPDPTSSTYSATITARPASNNARGKGGTTLRPTVEVAGNTQLLGSESYSLSVPIVYLPGRTGLDLDVTLYYNSHLWTISKGTSGGTATFNADRDYPGYGFRLGFGYLEAASGYYVLTEKDGTKRQLKYVSGTSYESQDSSYIKFDSSTKLLFNKNGTRVLYEPFSEEKPSLLRPVRISDRNGNFISIVYCSTCGTQQISLITDTVGRNIGFYYDADGDLMRVDRVAFDSSGNVTILETYAEFQWTQGTLGYAFSGLTVKDSPPNGTTLKVLSKVTLQDGSAYRFVYNSVGPENPAIDWGIVRRVDLLSGPGAVLKRPFTTIHQRPLRFPITQLTASKRFSTASKQQRGNSESQSQTT